MRGPGPAAAAYAGQVISALIGSWAAVRLRCFQAELCAEVLHSYRPGLPTSLNLFRMSTRASYQGPRRKLVLAFDVGTTYSGVSYW